MVHYLRRIWDEKLKALGKKNLFCLVLYALIGIPLMLYGIKGRIVLETRYLFIWLIVIVALCFVMNAIDIYDRLRHPGFHIKQPIHKGKTAREYEILDKAASTRWWVQTGLYLGAGFCCLLVTMNVGWIVEVLGWNPKSSSLICLMSLGLGWILLYEACTRRWSATIDCLKKIESPEENESSTSRKLKALLSRRISEGKKWKAFKWWFKTIYLVVAGMIAVFIGVRIIIFAFPHPLKNSEGYIVFWIAIFLIGGGVIYLYDALISRGKTILRRLRAMRNLRDRG